MGKKKALDVQISRPAPGTFSSSDPSLIWDKQTVKLPSKSKEASTVLVESFWIECERLDDFIAGVPPLRPPLRPAFLSFEMASAASK